MQRLLALSTATLLLGAFASPALAHHDAAPAVHAANTEKKAAAATLDAACVQTAVKAREDALIAGFSAFSSSVLNAYNARASALATAWGKTEKTERQAGIKAAWTAFQSSAKTARQTWMTARKTAWKTFRTAAKKCKGAAAELSAESSGESVDGGL